MIAPGVSLPDVSSAALRGEFEDLDDVAGGSDRPRVAGHRMVLQHLEGALCNLGDGRAHMHVAADHDVLSHRHVGKDVRVLKRAGNARARDLMDAEPRDRGRRQNGFRLSADGRNR